MPNAVDVLGSGSYRRFPQSIGEMAAKPAPTKAELDPMTPWQRFKAQTKIDNAAKVRAPHSIDC